MVLIFFTNFADINNQKIIIMDPILGILLFVWGVLNIILFFKIWGATNNIKKIKEKYVDFVEPSSLENLRSLHLQGRDEEAYAILNKAICFRINEILSTTIFKNGYINGEFSHSADALVMNDEGKKLSRNDYFAIELNKVVEEFMPQYNSIGREMPETIKKATYKDLINFGQKMD